MYRVSYTKRRVCVERERERQEGESGGEEAGEGRPWEREGGRVSGLHILFVELKWVYVRDLVVH